MSGAPKPPIGSVGWCDLTVPNAETVRDFYRDVIGWTSSNVDMGDYADYCMSLPSTGNPAAGVCWARGTNAGLPPVWLVYFVVASLDASLAQVKASGGEVLRPPGPGGGARFAVIRDPAGAVCALYESGD